MENYINSHENKEENLKTFNEMINISKCHSACKRYPVIKEWFLNSYPEVKMFGIPKEEENAEDSVSEITADSSALSSEISSEASAEPINSEASLDSYETTLESSRLSFSPSNALKTANTDKAAKKPNETFFKLEGNIKLFYESVSAMWTAFSEDRPFIPKKKSNKTWIAVLCLIFGIPSKNTTASSTDISRTSEIFLPLYFTSRVSRL